MRIARLFALALLLVPSTALADPIHRRSDVPARRMVVAPRMERAARAQVVSRPYRASPDHRSRAVVGYARSYPARAAVRTRVRVAPPPVRYEVRTRAPSHRHVWAPGYWGWQGGRHAWVRGAWMLPPAAGVVWIAPQWVADGGDWALQDGYWGPQTGAAYPAAIDPYYGAPVAPSGYYPTTDIDIAPPPLQYETPPPPPAPGYFWTPGYWGWNGRQHVWVRGHYEAPRVGWTWQPHRWIQVGLRWRFQTGGWISL